MLPKPGDPSLVRNWRSIALPKLTYKTSLKLTHSRIHVFGTLSNEGIRWVPDHGVDHTPAVFDTIMGYAVEWNVDVWCASPDWRKAFDDIEFKPFFDALRCQGIPGSYFHLLDGLYRSQSGSVEGGTSFSNTPWVKQCDVM